MSEDECLFCKIIAGKLPAKKLYEDDHLLAFEDINPLAPIHFLVIPKEHIATLDDLEEHHAELLGKMLFQATRLANLKGVGKTGYRQVINCRKSAGQVVYHLHMHIIGGRDMRSMG